MVAACSIVYCRIFFFFWFCLSCLLLAALATLLREIYAESIAPSEYWAMVAVEYVNKEEKTKTKNSSPTLTEPLMCTVRYVFRCMYAYND